MVLADETLRICFIVLPPSLLRHGFLSSRANRGSHTFGQSDSLLLSGPPRNTGLPAPHPRRHGLHGCSLLSRRPSRGRSVPQAPYRTLQVLLVSIQGCQSGVERSENRDCRCCDAGERCGQRAQQRYEEVEIRQERFQPRLGLRGFQRCLRDVLHVFHLNSSWSVQRAGPTALSSFPPKGRLSISPLSGLINSMPAGNLQRLAVQPHTPHHFGWHRARHPLILPHPSRIVTPSPPHEALANGPALYAV
jgi:hypothetical protein